MQKGLVEPSGNLSSHLSKKVRRASWPALLVGVCAFWTGASNVSATPLEDSWNAAEIWSPPSVTGIFRSNMNDPAMQAHLTDTARSGIRFPTVIFLHGCTAGRKPAGWTMARHLARAGYVVILPDSFVSKDRTPTCDRWSFAPLETRQEDRSPLLERRRAELDYAVQQARQLPWVDGDNVFVMGFDEGADALAAWKGAAQVRARVLISTLCPEGLDGAQLPTLTVGATDNSLFKGQSPSTCARKGPTEQKNFESTFHDLTGLPAARDTMMEFLRLHRAPSP